MAFNLEEGKKLIDHLSTEKLEKLVSADIDVDNAPDDILRWHIYAVAKLYHRYKNGERTTTDKWKAYHFSKTIKKLADHHRLTSFEHCNDVKNIIEEAKTHKPPTNFWSTGLFYTFFTWFTQGRLSTTRTNRLLALLEKAFLPAWFAIAGLLFGAELAFDIGVLLKATFSPKTAEEIKLGAWSRFKLALFKDNRITRMANAALWFGINLACFILPFALAGTITVLGFPLTIPIIIGALTLAGGILDIFVDAGGGLYALKQESDLLNDLETLDNSNQELNTIKHTLKNKKQETLISRFFRILNNDVIMAASMFLVFFPPTTLIGIAILGTSLTLIAAEFTANCTLPVTRNTTFDKIRLGFVFAVLAASLLFLLFPPAGLAVSLSLIGATVIVCVGASGLARRLYHADLQWVKDKASLAWESIKGWFCKKEPDPSAAPFCDESLVSAQNKATMLKGKSEDDFPKDRPDPYASDMEIKEAPQRKRSASVTETKATLFNNPLLRVETTNQNELIPPSYSLRNIE